jgi:acyl carrier protein
MDTFERVKKWLAASLGIHEEFITPEATIGELFSRRTRIAGEFEAGSSDSIVDSLSPDSLDAVELIMGLEHEFDVELPDGDIESPSLLKFNWNTTVRQIVNLIDKTADR